MTDNKSPMGQLALTRRIGASSAQLYAAWTEPRLMKRWFAPEPMRVTDVQVDLRVGGQYRIVVADPTQPAIEHVTVGEYRELVPDRKIVKTWQYSGPFEEYAGSLTQLTVELRALGPKLTEVLLTHVGLKNERAHEGTHAGWLSCLDVLENLHQPEHSFVTERRVAASLEQAYAAWTQPTLMRRWFGNVVEADVRVGGKFRVENHEDGQIFKHKGEYRVLEPGRRIVQTFEFDGEGEFAEHAKQYSDERITITFRALGPKLTLVTLTNSWNGLGMTDKERENLDSGWSDWLDRYERALAQL